jgi:hypothetical protein
MLLLVDTLHETYLWQLLSSLRIRLIQAAGRRETVRRGIVVEEAVGRGVAIGSKPLL